MLAQSSYSAVTGPSTTISNLLCIDNKWCAVEFFACTKRYWNSLYKSYASISNNKWTESWINKAPNVYLLTLSVRKNQRPGKRLAIDVPFKLAVPTSNKNLETASDCFLWVLCFSKSHHSRPFVLTLFLFQETTKFDTIGIWKVSKRFKIFLFNWSCCQNSLLENIAVPTIGYYKYFWLVINFVMFN